MAIKMRFLYSSKQKKMKALGELIKQEFQLDNINSFDIIPPAYSCENERLVILALSGNDLEDMVRRFCRELDKKKAQNVALLIDGNDKLAESYDDVRQIVAGDFNFTSPIHDAQNGASTVHTNPFVNEGYTDVNVNVDSTETKDGSGVIDFIYSKGFEAEGYTVVKAAGASNASDHYAIYAELTLN